MRSIDGIARHPHHVPLTPVHPMPPGSSAVTRPTNRHSFAPPDSIRPRRRWWRPLVLPLCVIGGLVAGFLMQSLAFGLCAAAAYAVAAWILHVPSRITFVLAFLALLTVVALLTVRQNEQLASNFATYTFVLLAAGVVSLVIESRAGLKHKRGKIRRNI